jgi:uncharacterized protein YprB with RNaseH-like and TPR domain
MNLASRLDRLRGHSFGSESDALSHQLERLRRGRSTAAESAQRSTVLAKALEAQSTADGLLVRRREYCLPAPGVPLQALSRLPEAWGLKAPDWVYIDTETTGLSGGVGNLAFMVGVARYSSERLLEVRQYLLGSFAAEAGMLRELFEWVGPDAVLVSYNGKCFDLPLLIGRLRMHRLYADLAALPHLDLMYSVRRAYRRHWPDCRLQTAEKRLLGLHRVGDLPGSEAPAAWQAWLRKGVTNPLQRAMEHNYQDVASLALLHRRLLHDYAGRRRSGIDHAAVGRAWRDAGHDDLARRVWESAGSSLDERGCLQLAALYRRQRQWALAESIWLRLHAGGNSLAALELSKYYEHRKRDYRKAMEFVADCDAVERDARLARLQSKLGRNLQLPLTPHPATIGAQRQ